MKCRKLRIAWSVALGLIAVLLCVLWVRSYWWAIIAKATYQPDHNIIVAGGQCYYRSNYGWNARWRHQGEIQLLPDFALDVQDIWNGDGRGIEIFSHAGRMPVCVFVFSVAAVAAFPWLPWWPTRFSLRALLMAMALVAVVLGLTAWAVRG